MLFQTKKNGSCLNDTSCGVSVIVPTQGDLVRRYSLERAICSIRSSSNLSICIIVVVNGNKFDPDVCTWLKAQPDVRFEYIETPSLPEACLRGRELVETEFFSFLDDDDIYLVNATDIKLDAIRKAPDSKLVITNGYRCIEGKDYLFYCNMIDVQENPLRMLFVANWLTSCNALFRTNSFPVQFFRNYHKYAEWTWIAFCMAMDGLCLLVVDEPTFRIYDTPGSLSKSDEYLNSILILYKRMLELSPPEPIHTIIVKRERDHYHHLSSIALEKNDLVMAWKAHLKSILCSGGWQYCSYTRHLLNPRKFLPLLLCNKKPSVTSIAQDKIHKSSHRSSCGK